MSKTYWIEIVKERVGDVIIMSDVRPATEEELEECYKQFLLGQCPHTIVEDTKGWLYDFRSCAICKKGLGML